MRIFIATWFFLITTSGITFAQNEVLRERNSLVGIAEFGVVVNIEKPGYIQSASLNTSRIREQIIEELADLPVTILRDRLLRESDQFPLLHIHINIMKAPDGTYPFAVELNFYQPVKLVLNRDLQTMASTWNKGQVGIVSENNLSLIANEAVRTVNLFKEDYNWVN